MKNKTVLIAVLLLLIVFPAIVFLVYSFVYFPKPQEVRVSNITDKSVTVSWETEKPSKGVVMYTEKGDLVSMLKARLSGRYGYDDRDESAAELLAAEEDWERASEGDYEVKEKGKYYMHHVTIKDLEPDKEYYFKVGNGVFFVNPKKTLVPVANLSFNFAESNSFMTTKQPGDILAPNPSYGQIVSPKEDSLMLLDDSVTYMLLTGIDRTVVLSAVSNERGKWYIDLTNARNKDGEIMLFNEDIGTETVYVNSGRWGESKVETIRMNQDAPAKDIEIRIHEGEFLTHSGKIVQEVYAGCPGGTQEACESSCHQGCDSDACHNGCWEACKSMCDSEVSCPCGACGSTVCGEDGTLDRCEIGGMKDTAAACKVEKGLEEREQEGSPNQSVEGNNCVCPGHCGYDETGCCDAMGWGTLDSQGNACCEDGWNTGGMNEDGEYTCKSDSGGVVNTGGGYHEIDCGVQGGVEDIRWGIDDSVCSQQEFTCSDGGKGYGDSESVVCDTNVLKVYECSSGESKWGYSKEVACREELSDGLYCGQKPEDLEEWKDGHKEKRTCPRGHVCLDSSPRGNATCHLYGNYCIDGDPIRWEKWLGNTTAEEVFSCSSGQVCRQSWDSNNKGIVECVEEGEGEGIIQKNGYYCTENGGKNWELWENGALKEDGICSGGGICVEFNIFGGDAECLSPIYDNICSRAGDSDYRVLVESHYLTTKECPSERPVCEQHVDDSGRYYVKCVKTQQEISEDLAVRVGRNLSEVPLPMSNDPDLSPPSTGCNNYVYRFDHFGWEGENCKAVFKSQKGINLRFNNLSNKCLTEPNDFYQDVKKDYCDGAGEVDIQDNDLLQNLINQVRAVEKTFTVSGSNILKPLEDGVYEIEVLGVTERSEVAMKAETQYSFYIDYNNNQIRDEDEELIDLSEGAVDIKFDDSKKVYEKDLKAGLNFVSFNHLPSTVNSCQLIKELNKDKGESGRVTQIARFESGKFELTTYRQDIESPVGGTCFPVIPGKGYVIRTLGDTAVLYGGYDLTEGADMIFNSGWNLIGVNGIEKDYTAKELIGEFNRNDEFLVNNITRWRTEASRYDGIQKEEDEIYGFDFPIYKDEGYFIRVVEGKGRWSFESKGE